MPPQGQPAIHPVILSGGSGTRLWPMSRAQYPKQLLPLLTENTLLQEAGLRVADAKQFAAPLVISNDDHRFIVAEQLRLAGVTPAAIILEPLGRNTAPACCVAALSLAATAPDALMLVMPSDHAITDTAAFKTAVARAADAAKSGKLVTFGIKASRPETGYGYIKRGQALAIDGAFQVAAFVEKPDRARAETYVADQAYSWNSGIFLFPVKLMLSELERLQPAMVAACRDALNKAKRDLDFLRLDRDAFAQAPSNSIDYAVMEHTDHAAVVPVEMGWSDVGTWDALWMVGNQDSAGNVTAGDVLVEDTKNSYLRAESGLLAVLGVEDLVVVATSDAVMVSRRDRAQDIKQIVAKLERDKRSELVSHPLVHRPWGTYRSIHNGERVQVKHIMVKPGGILSLQMHHHRAEHWVVVTGTAKVTKGNEEMTLHENESTFIPMGTRHRLENPGKIPLHLIEVQSGSYLGEDDIVRYDDTYGRA
ncbi:MAG TPA: mannose-1-phosphate guanylyltransferase/mannose-6-phosphate isomerase [Stellaceae bacterium]|jgi:mannose-1-phosphate guanylyltransferase/mannose-1-phosphate guanylyltransferase/mannose-6-phosphate isomerase|nr:mannose-1-phosphate guanylyltransferase/mannose-6-phosphate isomerase [Stellaceae bacterium]